MAISIDWLTKVISVPQSFLSALGGTSYSLDTNDFRIALRDLEDDEAGVVHPKTHNHNTSVLLGGIIYARIIEITNGYTVTFEDTGSPYKVFLVGSNNNILDVTNLNQVSVSPGNSAGLVQMAEIEYGAFGGGVHLDMANGVAGTLYPKGSPTTPVNNLDDAKTIAVARGFDTIYTTSDLLVDSTDDIDDYKIVGPGMELAVVNLVRGCSTDSTVFMDITVKGRQDGETHYIDCEAGQSPYPVTDTDAAQTISVVASAGTFTRVAGDFEADGFEHGMQFTASGLANNTGFYTVDTIDATKKIITILASEWSSLADDTGDGDEQLTIYCGLSNVHCLFERCKMVGPFTMHQFAGDTTNIIDCYSGVAGSGYPTFDMNNGPVSMAFRRYSGSAEVTNCTSSSVAFSYDLSSGRLILADTVTAGSFSIRGVGTLVDSSSGTATVNSDGLMSKATVAGAVGAEIGEEVQHAAYEGGISFDPTSGTDATDYPYGTAEFPCKTWANVSTINGTKGFNKVYLKGDWTTDAADDLDNFHIIGEGATINAYSTKSTLTMTSGCSTSGTKVEDLRLEGVQGGEIYGRHVVVGTVTDSHCEWSQCIMIGPVTMDAAGYLGDHTTDSVNCRSTEDWFTVDYNGAILDQVYSDWTGNLKITNCTNAGAVIQIGVDSGRVWLDSTCTAGTVRITGVGTVTDDSGAGMSVDDHGLVDKLAAIHGGLCYYDVAGTSGTDPGVGTFDNPSSVMADALTVITLRHLNNLHIHSDATLGATDDVTALVVEGHDTYVHTMTLTSGCITYNTKFKDIHLTGVATGVATYSNCLLDNISGVGGNLNGCTGDNTVTLIDDNTDTVHIDKFSSNTSTPVTLNIGATGVNATAFMGMFTITGKDDATAEVNIHATMGFFWIDSSCTAGTISIFGTGTLVSDASGAGCTVNTDNLKSPSTAISNAGVADAVLEDSRTLTVPKFIGLS